MTDKFFYRLGYFSTLFFFWGAVLLVYEMINQSENLISNTAFIMFLFGIALALESFKDPEKFSKSEIKKFSNRKKSELYFRLNFGAYLFPLILAFFFFKLDLIFPDGNPDKLNQLSDFGYACFSFGIGGISFTKQQYDKFSNFQKKSVNTDR